MKPYLSMTDDERRTFRTVPMRTTVVTRGNSHYGAAGSHLLADTQATHVPYKRGGSRGGFSRSFGAQWSLAHHRKTSLTPDCYQDAINIE